MARHAAELRRAAGRSRLDTDVEALVSLCGWLVAVVFVVGFVRGWWWGGDLHNLPWGLGDPAAEAVEERRGWPWVPILASGLGGLGARWVWLALADLVCGIDPRIRRRGWRL
ncbi:hypothetical protein OOK13_43230 [Streptomyces sp. NBC_00378]|uniref:hypothetical protein n=1 Tax=unclassified Streptomyces TaxID=2593676 RepID=UPI0022508C41|nr:MULTISPECIES: hypothetical protein [unclassified Streptomyces]MCX5115143.1 hypothetical protein [Streptomyces sp. NBC_00378]MEE1805183.1 hypothetical protein [Streptomyces sp. BE133]